MSAASQSVQNQPRTLVYGLGATGLSVARLMARENVDAIYADSREHPPGLDDLTAIAPDASVHLGTLSPRLLDNVATVVVSPGVAENDAFLKSIRAADVDVVSDIDLFIERMSGPFVAITGSNGKSTVTTLVAQMCAACGLRAPAGANLGEPALDLLLIEQPDVYVLELSSFQLQRTAYLPAQVAVLLNVTPDHLDWHRSEAEYVDAKYRIFAEAEAVVFNRDDPSAPARLPQGVPAVSFGLGAADAGDFGVLELDGKRMLARGAEALISVDELALVGEHNVLNALAALAVVGSLNLDVSAALGVLREFTGLPHRMQRVARVQGIDYIDDSKATNVAAAIASVRALSGGIVLLAGGQGKGGDFAALARSTAEFLEAIVVFGEDADELEQAFRSQVAVHRVANLEAAVAEASGIARPGQTVLLAPACASFDQFDNYGARGDAFAKIVQELAA